MEILILFLNDTKYFLPTPHWVIFHAPSLWRPLFKSILRHYLQIYNGIFDTCFSKYSQRFPGCFWLLLWLKEELGKHQKRQRKGWLCWWLCNCYNIDKIHAPAVKTYNVACPHCLFHFSKQKRAAEHIVD